MRDELSIQEQAYLQGFAVKCAEYGIDPCELTKMALMAPATGARTARKMGKILEFLKNYGKGLIEAPKAAPGTAAAMAAPGAAAGGLYGAFSDKDDDQSRLLRILKYLGLGGLTGYAVAPAGVGLGAAGVAKLIKKPATAEEGWGSLGKVLFGGLGGGVAASGAAGLGSGMAANALGGPKERSGFRGMADKATSAARGGLDKAKNLIG